MAKFALTDASVVINSVDLSDHVQSVEIEYSADTVEVTAMSDAAHNYVPGLLVQSINCTFLQNFAASKVDATLAPLIGAAAFTVTVKPTSGAVSATNPSYSGSFILGDYQPIGGSVGGEATASATFMVGAAAGVTRATS